MYTEIKPNGLHFVHAAVDHPLFRPRPILAQPTTVIVSGPYAFHMSSNTVDLRLTNLRFVIRDKAKFSMDSNEGGNRVETMGSVSFGTMPEIQV